MQVNPLWEYSVAIYRRPGVEPILLQLQDEYAVDVNLVLLCCWLARNGQQMTAEAVSEAISSTAGWREQCIQPLREVRRYLKGLAGHEHLHEYLREQVKELELEAEKVQQAQLYELWRGCPASSVNNAEFSFADLALQNLQCYTSRLPETGGSDASDLIAEFVSLIAG